jgi:hypothetical protein
VLTGREQAVARAVADGATNAEMTIPPRNVGGRD